LVSDTFLYANQENGKYISGRIGFIKFCSFLAIIFLLIACINFMNLSTARSAKRAKEVGIRKAVGAQKSSLIVQFIGESIFLSFLSAIVAILFVELSLPSFNQIIGIQLFIDFTNPYYWLFYVGFILFTGLLAGSYPAFFLSAFQPAKVLKGVFKPSGSTISPRKILVILQFTFAITLIICTILMHNQIKYAQSRATGYSRYNLIYTSLEGDVDKHYVAIKTALLNQGAATSVTKSRSPVTETYNSDKGFSWPGSTTDDTKVYFDIMSSDADFIKTMNITLLSGRDIDINNYGLDSTAILLNETAVKTMHLKDPIGKIVKYRDIEWHIVGVIKDFIYQSPYLQVYELMVQGPAASLSTGMHIKLNTANPIAKNLAIIEKIFKTYNPQYPFEYKFIDQEYESKFSNEKHTSYLAAVFAGLTIFISCLGLFGLATYMAENRIKEIGVRKVLGASVTSITTLLSKDFLKLVLISFVIASPIAWWLMSTWLASATYLLPIQWWVFVGVGLLTILIALTTVGYQAIKAAVANPVKSLRSE